MVNLFHSENVGIAGYYHCLEFRLWAAINYPRRKELQTVLASKSSHHTSSHSAERLHSD